MAESGYTDIVVGAGSSGAVIAARLSERPGLRVLLLEAGPDYPDPDGWPAALRDGMYPAIGTHDWGYRSEPVPGREAPFPRGKVVGGSSAINGCVALRPKPADFDLWSEQGNEGWTWEEVLPYFVRLEDDKDFDGPYHGKGGPIPIRRWREAELTAEQKAFQEAARALGYPEAPDHNDPDALGIGPLPLNNHGGVRHSTALTYLAAARGRANLAVLGETLVERVLIEGGRAVGVRVLEPGGGVREYRAERVTVCAGVIATPALLNRSGVGAAEGLKSLGVPVAADLPGVGENLLDHCTGLLTMQSRPGLYDESTPVAQMMLQYTAEGSDEIGDMQLYMFGRVDLHGYGYWIREPLGADKAIILSAAIEIPKSAGRIVTGSADPREAPRILSGYLGHPEDLRKLREGMRISRRLAADPHLRLLTTGNLWPKDDVIGDDTALDAFLKQTVYTHYHPVGTAKMGPAADRGAVVDARCRVHGVEGLRVADASVMPVMVRSNTNLACIMIGERVAEWIAADAH